MLPRYSSQQITEAWRLVARTTVDLAAAANDCRVSPTVLVGLASGLTTHVLGEPTAANRDDCSRGTTAFVAGMLSGSRLSSQAGHESRRLRDAVDIVWRLGRHRVISSRCDLNAVAAIERDCARALIGNHQPNQGPMLTPLCILFELGFAVGLVINRHHNRRTSERTLTSSQLREERAATDRAGFRPP